MTEKADPTADPIPEPILEPIDEAAEEAAEPVETLAQINSQTLPAGNWGWRAVVALTVGAGLVASGVWMSENFGGGETQLREQAARIDALASERATLRNALTATEAELDGVADRLAAVDQRLAALTDAMGGVTAAADFDVLAGDVNTRLGVLEAARENPVDQVDTTAALADLADRLGAMEAMAARIAALEAFAQSVGELADARPGEGVVAAPNPALSIRLAELEQDLRTLDAALAVAVETLAAEAVVPDLSQVEARLTEVEETLRSVGPAAASRGSASALVLAAGQLRDRLLGPGPFRAELDTVRQVAQSRVLVDRELQSAMNRLGDLASDGVVTVDQLTREFSGLARQIVTATAPDEGWVADLWGRVRGVISVRRTGDIEGDTTQAIVARAEVRLADRDLAGAVAELDSLDGPSLNAVRSWMVLARARATADEAAALIATRAVALLAQEFGPTP
jgi:hypothetical protein